MKAKKVTSIQEISYGAVYGPNSGVWLKELASKARKEIEAQADVKSVTTLLEPEMYPGNIHGTVKVVYTALAATS
ncbi:hypothetical protein SEA_LASTRESORT_44 [Gordonia phage LastResort]|nr:hypothetical protein SEA_LASTRESORT_44 [Gordonia phage LastResort]QDM56220.1 hypothetical protein SEA_REMO_44 [Gordonia phage ReMo]